MCTMASTTGEKVESAVHVTCNGERKVRLPEVVVEVVVVVVAMMVIMAVMVMIMRKNHPLDFDRQVKDYY